MSESKETPSCARPNRRKEVFRAVRGSKLTGQRGGWSAGPDIRATAGTKTPVLDEELLTKRRVRLGSMVEDEADSTELPVTRRYSEPND